MTKISANKGTETKSDIFPQDIFKSGIIFFVQKILKYFNKVYKYLIFMTKVSAHKGKETKSDIFSRDILKSGIIVQRSKTL